MSPTVYLISGANRGIGLGLVASLAKRDNVVVFAGARNPSGASDLQALVKQYPGKVHAVKLTSASKEDNEAAVAKVKKDAGRLDVVIANAGINQFFGPTLTTPPKDLSEHYEVNVLGPLVLFQATYPLLKQSTLFPKFVAISTIVASIADGAQVPVSMLPYSASKAALNSIIRRWHFEFPDLTVFPIHPGGVDTDMAKYALTKMDKMENIPFISVEESIVGLLKQIDNGTRESSGGQFLSYTGDRLSW